MMEYGNVPPPSQVMSKKFKKLILKIVLALSGSRNAQRAQNIGEFFEALLSAARRWN
jgi:hypothetical protein